MGCPAYVRQLTLRGTSPLCERSNRGGRDDGERHHETVASECSTPPSPACERFGLAKTTVEDVAQAAELSRATVYRQFGNRDALLLAVAARDAERTASEAELYLQQFDDVGSWIVEGMLFCLREFPSGRSSPSFWRPRRSALPAD